MSLIDLQTKVSKSCSEALKILRGKPKSRQVHLYSAIIQDMLVNREVEPLELMQSTNAAAEAHCGSARAKGII